MNVVPSGFHFARTHLCRSHAVSFLRDEKTKRMRKRMKFLENYVRGRFVVMLTFQPRASSRARTVAASLSTWVVPIKVQTAKLEFLPSPKLSSFDADRGRSLSESSTFWRGARAARSRALASQKSASIHPKTLIVFLKFTIAFIHSDFGLNFCWNAELEGFYNMK